jgi:hypothetical protein
VNTALHFGHFTFVSLTHSRRSRGKGRQERQCQDQANQFFHSPSPPFFFQINFRIPKGNFETVPPSALLRAGEGKKIV